MREIKVPLDPISAGSSDVSGQTRRRPPQTVKFEQQQEITCYRAIAR